MTPLTQYLTQTYALAWLILIPLAASLLLMAMPKTWALTIRLVSAIAAGITLVIDHITC